MNKLLIALTITIALTSCKVVAPILISDDDEKQVGLKYHSYLQDSLKSKILPASDPKSVWINEMGKRLADQQDRRNFTRSDFTFTVVNEDIVNAFALPGGYIYIYSGLINKAATADQVAGVVAHEIGHVSAQHYKEIMVKSAGLEMISQILGGDDGSIAANVGKYLIGMKMSRNNEYEADSLATAYVRDDKTWSPWGMKHFLDTLATMDKSLSLEMLTTHPDPDKRTIEVARILNETYKMPLSSYPDAKPKPF